MILPLAEFMGLDPSAHLLLVFLRVGAMFFFLPIFGSTTVSVRIRLGLVLVVSGIIAPMVPMNVELDESRSAFLAACAAEVFSGLLFGFACRGIFWIIQVAGTMSAQAISLSQILGNQVEQPAPAIGQITYMASLALAAVLDFHVLIVSALVQSYDILALGLPIPDQILATLSIDAVSKLFYAAFGLAGPFLVVAVLYNLCLGVVNKAMPQLMVAFVGAPAVTWLGIVVLFLSAPVILQTWKTHLLSLSLIYGGP